MKILKRLIDGFRCSGELNNFDGFISPQQQPLEVESLEPRVLFSAAPVEPLPDSGEPGAIEAPEQVGEGEAPQNQASDAGEIVPLDSVELLAEEAKERWIASGISDTQIAALDSINYVVANLGGNNLGVAEGTTITIDDDAGGTGSWFVDATPSDDTEFLASSSATLLTALSNGEAAGRFDLLSVLIHEQGHILGLGDLDGNGADVMNGLLSQGTRRLPLADQAEGAVPGSVEGPAYLAGDLNTAFGTSGVVTTDFTGGDDFGRAAVMDGSGSIIVAGYTENLGVGGGGDYEIALARYLPDGSLDPTFGTGGLVTTDLSSGQDDLAEALVLDSSGNIIIAGRTQTGAATDQEFVLARYTSSGALDTSFGTGGFVVTDFNGTDDHAFSVTIDGAGRIVAVGIANNNFGIARYLDTGALDTTFGTNGRVENDIGFIKDEARSVAVDSSGNIFVGGYYHQFVNNTTDFAVMKFDSAGVVDPNFMIPGFTANGAIATDFHGYDDLIHSIALDGSGDLIVAGNARYFSASRGNDIALAKYDGTTGALDPSFGNLGNGLSNYGGPGFDWGYDIQFDSEGRIVLAGASYLGTATLTDFLVARLTANGILDTSFGTAGFATTDFSGGDDSAHSVMINAAGDIIVAGTAFNGTDSDFALASYSSFSPEITVTHDLTSVEIPDGDTTPSGVGDEGTDFGSIPTAGGLLTRTFRITNDGSADLILSGQPTATTGTHFSVGTIQGGALTIAPAGSRTFTVTFDPTEDGTYTDTITILNDDGNEGVYTFEVSGTGTPPPPPTGIYLNEIVADIDPGAVPDNPHEYVEIRGTAGQSLDGVFLAFVESDSGSTLGQINSGSSNLIDLSAYSIGANGFLAIVDGPIGGGHPYAIAPNTTIVDVSGFDIENASFTALLIHHDGTGADPVSGQDLDVGDDGLDALPTGWTVLDGVAVLDGGSSDRAYASIVFSSDADGLTESGAVLVNTGFGTDNINHVMRIGDSTGSTASDWVAFDYQDSPASLPPDFVIEDSTDANFEAGSLVTNHLGQSNPTSTTAIPTTSSGAGELDVTFSTDGKAILDLNGFPGFANAVAVDGAGNIILGGALSNGTDVDFVVARLLPNGTLDPTFGINGFVVTDLGGSESGQDLVIDGSGNFIVGGYVEFDYALARYDSNGVLDLSFGGSGTGFVTSDLTPGSDIGQSLAIDGAGNLYLAGYANSDFAVARYTPSGVLDASFGTGGLVTTDFGSSSDIGKGITLDGSGNVIIAGYSDTGSTVDFALVRYTSAGVLDTSFGSGGTVLTDISSNFDIAYDVTTDVAGNIVVAGQAFTNLALVRYTSSGALDPTFGTGGKVVTNLGGNGDQARSVLIDAGGNIVVSGYYQNVAIADFAVARYTSSGSLDSSFGTGGIAIADFGGGDFGLAATFDAAGNVVVAGSSNSRMAVARFLAPPPPPTTITTNGSGDLVIADTTSGTDNRYHLASDGTSLTVTDLTGASLLLSGIIGTGSETNSVTIDLSQWAGSVLIAGQDGDDELILDFSSGNFGRDVTFHGGGQTLEDSLTILGGEFTDATFEFTNENDGSVDLDGQTITYTGLEPITSSVGADNVILTFTGSDETITLSDGVLADDGILRVDSTLGEQLDFAIPAASLTINATNGADSIDVAGIDDVNWTAVDLVITGDGGDDTTFSAATDLGSGDLDLRGMDDLVIAAAVSSTSGDLSFQSDTLSLTGSLQSTGNLVFKPTDTSATIGIGGYSGTLEIGDAELDRLANGFASITIGDAVAGTGHVRYGTYYGIKDSIHIVGGSFQIREMRAADTDVHVAITARTGSIIDDTSGGASNDITTTGTILLRAATGIDPSSNGLDLSSASAIAAFSTSGNINLHGLSGNGDLRIGTAGGFAGLPTVSGVSTGDDFDILLDSDADRVVVTHQVTATGTGEIVVTAQDGILLDGALATLQTAGGDLVLDSGSGSTVTANDPAGFFGAGSGIVRLSSGQWDLRIGNSDSIEDASTVVVGSGTVLNTGSTSETLAGITVEAGGLLEGSGTITGNVLADGGTVGPGNSPGIIQVIGDFTLGDDSLFDVEIGGTTPGTQHDQTTVTGDVTFGSNAALSLTPSGGFVPTVGQTFTLIDNQGSNPVSGQFAGLGEGAVISDFLGSGLNATISYLGGDGNDVVLTAASATSTTVSLSGSDLVITDTEGNTANRYQVTSNGTSVTLTDLNGGTIELAGVNGDGDSTASVTINLTEWTGAIQVLGQGGDDELILDFSTGNFGRNVIFEGGTQTVEDTLTFTGGTFTDAAFDFANENDGSVNLDGQTITYTGLEPINSSINATNVTLNYSAANDLITVQRDVLDPNLTLVFTDPLSPTAELVAFANPTSTLTINAGDGDDGVDLQGFGNGFGANLIVNGGPSNGSAAGDLVNISGRIDFGSGNVSIGELGDVDGITFDVSADLGGSQLKTAGNVILEAGTQGIRDLQFNGAATNLIDIEADTVTLRSTGILGESGIGNTGFLDVTANELNTDTATNGIDQFLNVLGTLTELDLDAGSGNITLYAGINPGDSSNIDGTPSGVFSAIRSADIGNDVTATSATFWVDNASFGVFMQPIHTSVDSLSVHSFTDQYIWESDGLSDLELEVEMGHTSLRAGGAILDTSRDGTDISALSAKIAANQVGSNAHPDEALDTEVIGLEVNSGPGGQFIDEVDGLTLINLQSSGDIVLKAGGDISDGDFSVDVAAPRATIITDGSFGASGAGVIDTDVNELRIDTSSANGDQFLKEVDGFNLLRLNAGSGDVDLTSGGTLYHAPGGPDIVANSATINLTGGSIGTGVGPGRFTTQVSHLNTITATPEGDQFIQQQGALSSLQLNAGNWKIDFISNADIEDIDGDLDIVAGTTSIVTTGNLGTATHRIGTSVDQLYIDTSVANGLQFLQESNGLTDLELNAGNGNIDLRVLSGDAAAQAHVGLPAIHANRLTVTVDSGNFGTFGAGAPIGIAASELDIDTSGGDGDQSLALFGPVNALDLDAGSGDVELDNNAPIEDADAGVDIIANFLRFVSDGGFGSVNPLQTQISQLRGVNTNAGDVRISNTGSLVIGDSIAGLTNSAPSVSGGRIEVISSGPITVNKDVIAEGDLLLETGDSLSAGNDLTISSGTEVSSHAGTLTIAAGDSLNLNAGALVSALDDITLIGGSGAGDTANDALQLFGTIETAGHDITWTSPAIRLAFTLDLGLASFFTGPAGTLRFGSGSTLDLAIAGPTIFDALTTELDVDLANAALSLGGPHTPVAGDSYKVIDTTGTLTGTFSNLTNGGIITLNSAPLTATYDATSLTLAGGPPPGPSVSPSSLIDFDPLRFAEGTTGDVTLFDFEVQLKGLVTDPVTVNYRAEGGTAATGDGDFDPSTGTLTFDGSDRVFTETGELEGLSGFSGKVRVALGDINGDGISDRIVSGGPGGGPLVQVFDGITGSTLMNFFAYTPTFAGGVFVASGDVNNDGKDDIITGADAGGVPHVKVFSGTDGSELGSFFAFAPSFTGGVRVAAGDVNGDGFADIITGAGAGGSPTVTVFDGGSDLGTPSILHTFDAFAPTFTGGVFVASGDVNNDGKNDIITGAGSGGAPHVRVFDGQNPASPPLHDFIAFSPTFTGGVRVGSVDINGDGKDDIVTGTGPGASPVVRVFDGGSTSPTPGQLEEVFPLLPGATGGIWVAGGGLGEVIVGGSESGSPKAKTYQPVETEIITIRVNGDDDVEGDETFSVELSGLDAGTNRVLFSGGGTVETRTGTIAADELDYGDLPDSTAGTGSGDYQTTLANGGASHLAIPELKLGAEIDAEISGQPDASALGDDNSGDDEDGVSIPGIIVAGNNATITITSTNNTGGDATVYGFIDWNNDGEFTGPNEVATAIVPDGSNDFVTPLVFAVPIGATINTDLGARFRISTDHALGANGAAPDGEVEDYLLRVLPPGAENAASVDPSGNAIITADGNGDIITVTTDGSGNLVISTPDDSIIAGSGTSAALNGDILIPLAGLTSLTIDGGDDDDVINLYDLTGFTGSLDIDGGDGQDHIQFGATVTLDPDNDASFTSEEFDAVHGSLTTQGSGSIIVEATGSNGGSGFQVGIDLLGSDLRADGTGSISLTGQGGATDTNNQGIQLTNGSSVSTNSGDIELTGTGGSGTSANQGIMLHSSSSVSAGGSGNLTINGQGGDGTSSNDGVYLVAGSSASVDDGDLVINGTAGSGSALGNRGVQIATASVTSSGAGNIQIAGTGSGSDSHNTGILLNASDINATGTGSIALQGIGSTSGVSYNQGVKISQGTLTTASGNIDIDGIGNGSALYNTGVATYAGATISAGGAGILSIDGTAGNATSYNGGVLISGGSNISTTNGSLSITGTGGGTLTGNRGIQISGRSVVESTGSGTLTLTGTGSQSSTGLFNSGIFASYAILQANSGDLIITGVGGAGSSYNIGARLIGGSYQSTLGLLDIDGAGGVAASGIRNYGVWIQSAAAGGGSGSAIDGTGGNGTGYNHGVYANSLTGSLTPGDVTGSITDGNSSSKDTLGSFFP